ncbi:MAG TPA: XRE family transcriptional regulator [Lysinibacillus sp.]|uniref:Transcriptional regulator n=1 Tax=Lysinibacillus parviboronicapiens TaxID=436516 RepID=A0ABV2PNQ0_9BACI|nr:helix-turn-helix transcriptional regulator [Lysinibacillus sp. OF-1]WCH47808.1 helix-turn-helix transcriptional regulator [Lysinibacillus sp. OF-1]HBT72162.1 XRE family transcriptional regulator [Lysinibacillus sp.]
MTRKVKVKIHELVNQRGISLRELSRLTDIRHAALSELANQKRQNINFSHIEKIADTLELDDIRDIIDLIEDKDK